ncbi:MAG TPA: hypothetical protein VFV38_43125 [Ktedonobacteraceae bacterium]|nr:hypothetical protein [Ktedonobacteraceae bacterium]
MTEEEIAQLRSYLAAQSTRRTPPQMIEALLEAHRQFTADVAVLPDTPPDNMEPFRAGSHALAGMAPLRPRPPAGSHPSGESKANDC